MVFKLFLVHTYTEEQLNFYLAEAKLLKKANPNNQKLENRIQQIKSELRKKGEPIK